MNIVGWRNNKHSDERRTEIEMPLGSGGSFFNAAVHESGEAMCVITAINAYNALMPGLLMLSI